ncbi:MAG: site-2 protease family protein [Clostridia bacterium]|nr:site-2 protease family protein [Clostridia bacterium]MBO5358758.1 site-2 protease family protein [Clostridia bacterium]
MTISEIWGAFWPYLTAVLLFLILIVIHEFGHFIAAKLLGVKVNEFAVGFGPRLFGFKGKETKYSFNLVPLGGYCAMEGEDEESGDSRAFCNKSAWRRFLIVIMGATFNLIFGLILVAIILAPQSAFVSTTIAEFSENAVTQQSGLKVDDKIIEIEGRKIFGVYDMNYAFTNVEDGKLDMVVLRDGKKVELKDVKFETEEEQGITYLKWDFKVYGIKKTVWNYIKETFNTTISYCLIIWRSLLDMLAGKYGISAISGPVGVTVAIADAAKQSLLNLLPMMALITVNLGIFNLLPVPALDGGRLVFILFEMIFRKKVPEKYEAVVHTVGFVVLIAFMVLVAAKDIWGLIF